MRRLATILLGSSSLFALADPVLAADLRLPMVTKAPVATPFSWNGCYVGGHLGGGWGREDVSNGEVYPNFGTQFLGFRDDIDGFLGGVQAGCNHQVNANWLIGVEGQFSWTDIKGDFSRDPFLLVKSAGRGTFSAKVDWIT